MNRKRILSATWLVLLGLVLSACVPISPAAQPTGAPLEETLWAIQSYVNSDGQTVQAVPGVDATVTFQDGAVNGTTGCNNFFGAYTADGNNLGIEVGGMTMMACPDPLMAQEQDFVAALNSTATYETSGSELILSDADGNIVATFSILEPLSLTGTTWVAISYNNGKEAVVSLVIGTEITALFNEDGTLSGSAGCNNYTAAYQVEDQAIQIGPAASTRMMCGEPEGIMDQEAQYLAALEMAEVYRIEADRLELRTSAGSLVASYSAQADMPQEGETQPAGSTAEIVGVLWKWQGSHYNNDTSAIPDDPDSYTLELQPDGNAAVQADCNRASGSYTLDGSQITIEILVSTMAMCPEGSLEAQFLQDLNAVAIYFMQEGKLFLDMKMDTGAMEFAQ